MHKQEDAQLLRIFLSERERHHQNPLYEAIVLKAREFGLRGATVLRGPLGYGHSSRLHKTKIFHLSEDYSIIVEIVDTAEKIETFLPVLDAMMVSGLVTLEKARILTYGASAHDGRPA